MLTSSLNRKCSGWADKLLKWFVTSVLRETLQAAQYVGKSSLGFKKLTPPPSSSLASVLRARILPQSCLLESRNLFKVILFSFNTSPEKLETQSCWMLKQYKSLFYNVQTNLKDLDEANGADAMIKQWRDSPSAGIFIFEIDFHLSNVSTYMNTI